ncbi:sigma-70 family RNA polymerase sigma factor [Phytopseudomonas dryadis]|uniref:RNA polymerase subunit sigma n=1 Tax=Phytopseudomonas dryadis TaxID=2487520 RepID=A0A4Q9R373_9GAMM|nr:MULTISPECIES: sigma-70 family RNA polymerase sigma factor [Pseudomonas]TBU94414.1 RNA polymerase subunit sigma [Pseudomonas dryadis]TBU99554.1 RNA polymerase subunit sigma [Pseudomonas dryadis]TBV12651.1 RNA polymerase subunit sigma [Pseudomonas sp. FRB 230]
MPPASLEGQRLAARNHVLQQLFGDHHGWLLSRLRARLGCAYDAADMAAETFAQVVALPDPQGIHEPRALLTTIAKRLVFASWRRRDLERAYLEVLAQQPLAHEPSAEEQAQALEALLAIDTLLAGLSPRGRSAFLYSQLEGLTYAEIGRRLGISAPRVHQYVVKAMGLCYLALEGDER